MAEFHKTAQASTLWLLKDAPQRFFVHGTEYVFVRHERDRDGDFLAWTFKSVDGTTKLTVFND